MQSEKETNWFPQKGSPKKLKNPKAKDYVEAVECKMSLYTILLVEDDFDDQFLAKQKLEELNEVGQVVCFSNGRDLIQYLHDQINRKAVFLQLVPVIIVLDLNMPLLNGFEVLKEIKSDPLLQTIPIAVVSGTSSKMEVDKAFGLGANAIFKKPLNVADLNVFFNNKKKWHWPWENWSWSHMLKHLH